MGLQGTLDTWALPDVLRLLAMTRKTGCLTVEGDQSRGKVSIRLGALVDATLERFQPDPGALVEVIFELSRSNSGSYRFTPSTDLDVDGPRGQDLERIVGHAKNLLLEWRELKELVPSSDHRIGLAAHLSCASVTIDAEHWSVLPRIADRPTVADLAGRLALGELDVMRAVRALVNFGVVVVEPPMTPRSPSGGRGPETGEDVSAAAMSRPSRGNGRSGGLAAR